MICIIDGATIKSEADLHSALKNGLQLGAYYGNNLAALWDSLTVDVARPVHIIWENSELSKTTLGEDVFGNFLRLFQDIETYDAQFDGKEVFTFQLIQ